MCESSPAGLANISRRLDSSDNGSQFAGRGKAILDDLGSEMPNQWPDVVAPFASFSHA